MLQGPGAGDQAAAHEIAKLIGDDVNNVLQASVQQSIHRAFLILLWHSDISVHINTP